MANEKIEKAIERTERNHWWFVGRRKILSFFIEKYLKKGSSQVLSIGCGPGVEMEFLENYGKVTGLDSSEEMLNYCKEKGITNVVSGRAQQLPFPENSFDCVVALDVLEHIEDDSSAIKEIRRVLKNGGAVLITVPAMPWLYGDFDKLAGHARRYSKQELEKKLEEAGFSPVRMTYFNTFLFVPIVIVRKIKTLLSPIIPFSAQELDYAPGWMNKVLQTLFGFESILLRHMNFPAGISLIAIVSKK